MTRIGGVGLDTRLAERRAELRCRGAFAQADALAMFRTAFETTARES